MNARPHSGRSGVPAAMDSDRGYQPLLQQRRVYVDPHNERSIISHEAARERPL